MTTGLLTTSFPRFAGDYAGCFVADRARALAAEGHAVEVMAAGDATSADARPDDLPPTITVTRLRVGDAGAPPLFYGAGAPEVLEGGGPSAWLAAARFSIALAGAARGRAGRWDAVEAHWLLPSALAALSAAPELPVRAYAHSGDVALLERIPVGRSLARRLAAGIGDLRFVSDELRGRFAQLAGRDVGTVAALPLPPAFARRVGPDPELRRELALTSPTLLAVGRLVPIKGHERLLRACALARAQAAPSPAARPVVVILGDGPERDRLANLAAALGIELRLPGFVPRPDVARWLAAADLYVQPSVRLPTGRGEGAPMATAEARAVGIPVVVDSDPARLATAIRGISIARNPIVTAV